MAKVWDESVDGPPPPAGLTSGRCVGFDGFWTYWEGMDAAALEEYAQWKANRSKATIILSCGGTRPSAVYHPK